MQELDSQEIAKMLKRHNRGVKSHNTLTQPKIDDIECADLCDPESSGGPLF